MSQNVQLLLYAHSYRAACENTEALPAATEWQPFKFISAHLTSMKKTAQNLPQACDSLSAPWLARCVPLTVMTAWATPISRTPAENPRSLEEPSSRKAARQNAGNEDATDAKDADSLTWQQDTHCITAALTAYICYHSHTFFQPLIADSWSVCSEQTFS